MASEQITVTLRVIETLEQLGIPYLIGGSLASAVHGVVRATLDTDLVAELQPEHAAPLVQALTPEFYVDADAVETGIRRRSSFNLIHLQSMFKIDIFVSRRRLFDRSRFNRRERQVVIPEPERTAYVSSAEDMVLVKLEWYRQGGQVSERQWRDVLGILKIQQNRLDPDYLRRWAVELGVADLLEKALQEAVAGH